MTQEAEPMIIVIIITFSTMFLLQENRTFEFLDDYSNGRESDKIFVPNVPMLTTASLAKPTGLFDLYKSTMVSGLWGVTNALPFKVLVAKIFIFYAS
jgi:hypothetical protein